MKFFNLANIIRTMYIVMALATLHGNDTNIIRTMYDVTMYNVMACNTLHTIINQLNKSLIHWN